MVGDWYAHRGLLTVRCGVSTGQEHVGGASWPMGPVWPTRSPRRLRRHGAGESGVAGALGVCPSLGAPAGLGGGGRCVDWEKQTATPGWIPGRG